MDAVNSDRENSAFEGSTGLSRAPEKLARTLYVAAWTVEICAVVAGFLISLVTATQGYENILATNDGILTISEWINLAVATIPFVLIAIVEITKIPVAGAAYSAPTALWRFVFTVVLLFLALITFETMLNGLERSYSAMTVTVDKLRDRQMELDASILDQIADRTELASLTAESIDGIYNARLAEARQGLREIQDEIGSQITELVGSVADEQTIALEEEKQYLIEELKGVRSSKVRAVKTIEDEIESLNSGRDTEINLARAEINRQIRRKEDAREAFDSRKQDEISAANFFTRTETRNRLDEEAADLDEELAALYGRMDTQGKQAERRLEGRRDHLKAERERFDRRIEEIRKQVSEKSRDINKSLAAGERDIGPQRTALRTQQDQAQNRFSEEEKKATQERDRRLEDLAVKEGQIQKLTVQIGENQSTLRGVNVEINEATHSSQVYRIAKQFWTPAEGEPDDYAHLDKWVVTVVASIWFTSLAAVVAFTGIMLALASYVIGDIGRVQDEREPPWLKHTILRTTNSFRKALVAHRKRSREPTIKTVYIEKEVPREVVREVPVDKVVIKEVVKEVPVEKVLIREVPRDIIQKEIVHVPMYTSDRALLGKLLTEGDAKES